MAEAKKLVDVGVIDEWVDMLVSAKNLDECWATFKLAKSSMIQLGSLTAKNAKMMMVAPLDDPVMETAAAEFALSCNQFCASLQQTDDRTLFSFNLVDGNGAPCAGVVTKETSCAVLGSGKCELGMEQWGSGGGRKWL